MASIQCLALMLLLLFTISQAREFLINGNLYSWKIPSSPDEFNNWAQKHRFRIGDVLAAEYDPKADSILEVSEEDYKNCNRANPIKSYQKSGKTTIELDRSGWFFFISGADGHCEKGQKLTIKVLSHRHGGAPAPKGAHPPAPAPSQGAWDSATSAPAPAPAKAAADGLMASASVGVFVLAALAFLMA